MFVHPMHCKFNMFKKVWALIWKFSKLFCMLSSSMLSSSVCSLCICQMLDFSLLIISNWGKNMFTAYRTLSNVIVSSVIVYPSQKEKNQNIEWFLRCTRRWFDFLTWTSHQQEWYFPKLKFENLMTSSNFRKIIRRNTQILLMLLFLK